MPRCCFFQNSPGRALVFLLAVAGAAPLAAQISPGELSRVHARLEGSANCLECHQPGQGVTAERCLACHQPLRQRIAAGRGLHARPEYRRCETCHIEHHGRGFRLIDWGKKGEAGFDHRQTGFRLEGAHAALSCRACHQPARLREAGRLAAGNSAPARTFLGLGTACLSCHRDEHRGQFAPASCLSCHTLAAWRPPSRFDHVRTAFPLTGRHQAVACASCHPSRTAPPPTGDSFFQLKGVAHQRCGDCHRDPHQGKFGPTCRTCHSTAGWRQVDPARFDHDRTGFPLTGRHRAVACTSCHRPRGGSGPAFGKLAHGRCTDCHRDPHAGRFGASCQTCHSTAGWRPAKVAAGFDHGRTRFPLAGAHRGIACQQCHRPGQPLRIARFERCADCHRDAHAGQLAGRADGGACEGCHDVRGFSPSKFTLEAHQKTGFPLAGAHRAVACDACHRPVPLAELPAPRPALLPSDGRSASASPGGRVRQFRFASTECRACHGDPHRGEADRAAGEAGCAACHSVESWRQPRFDHDRTRFPLAGAHRSVACGACHQKVDRGTPRERVHLRSLPAACAACHRDPHEGRFTRGPGPAKCQECHATQAWRPAAFDHDRFSRFELEGAHRRLPCGACHPAETRDGRTTLRYRPLPTTCEGCHGTRAEPARGG